VETELLRLGERAVLRATRGSTPWKVGYDCAEERRDAS